MIVHSVGLYNSTRVLCLIVSWSMNDFQCIFSEQNIITNGQQEFVRIITASNDKIQALFCHVSYGIQHPWIPHLLRCFIFASNRSFDAWGSQQNDRHFTDDILKYMFSKENVYNLIKSLLVFFLLLLTNSQQWFSKGLGHYLDWRWSNSEA